MKLRGRASAHGAMGCLINPSWWTHSVISRSSQCPETRGNKFRGMCYLVYEMVHIKTLAANRNE